MNQNTPIEIPPFAAHAGGLQGHATPADGDEMPAFGDAGHAHLGDGVATVLSELRPLIRSTHLHDNKGDRDSHLWPGDGTIAWDETIAELKTAPQTPAGVLEIHYSLEDTPESVTAKAQAAFEKFGL